MSETPDHVQEGKMPSDPKNQGFTPLCVKKGDLVVFHGQVFFLSELKCFQNTKFMFSI